MLRHAGMGPTGTGNGRVDRGIFDNEREISERHLRPLPPA
jgi:hypothetical protein